MKIDEACINHNALRLINDIVGFPYEYGDQDESTDHLRLLTLGEVRGVLEMTEAMKGVLKGEENERSDFKSGGDDALYHVDEYNGRSVKAIRNLPPAGPERKVGKWIFKKTFPNDESEFPIGCLICSECGSHHSNATPCNFCDNCGADMRGEEQDG